MVYHTIIIGGGPAGLMAANQLEYAHVNYLLLEKNEKCGKKLLLTGGRRCNVTNHLSIKAFIDTLTFKHKRFLYPALQTFSGADILSFFKDHHLEFVLENNFKYFPKTEKSLSVLEALMADINPKHIAYQQHVKHIVKENDHYQIVTKDQTYWAKHVIVATGSNSFPSTGSSGDGLGFAKELGIPFYEFTPAETHIYSNQIKQDYQELRGISLNQVVVKIKKTNISFQGDLLFTHFGLSGPVIMHLSEFIDHDIREKGTSTISFPLVTLSYQQLYDQLQSNNHRLLHKILEEHTTKRIVQIVLDKLHIPSRKIVEMKKSDLIKVCETFTSFDVLIDNVEVKEKAYVNKGGIDTKALDPKSMASRDYKGLYFVGEVTDLHGPIGGYNITIALSTGYLAAQDILSTL